MKTIYVVFAVLVLGAIWFGCSSSSACDDYVSKVTECYDSACSGKTGCAVCDAYKNAASASGETGSADEATCQKALDAFDCEKTVKAAITAACP